jgi:hypothetical protein
MMVRKTPINIRTTYSIMITLQIDYNSRISPMTSVKKSQNIELINNAVIRMTIHRYVS